MFPLKKQLGDAMAFAVFLCVFLFSFDSSELPWRGRALSMQGEERAWVHRSLRLREGRGNAVLNGRRCRKKTDSFLLMRLLARKIKARK